MKNIKMNITTVVLGVSLMGSGLAMANGKGGPSDAQKLIANARAATAKYHNVDVALADGYIASGHCVQNMGYHYFKPEYLLDPEVNEIRPEVLLYEDSPFGGLRLVGVEYYAVDEGLGHPYLFIDRLFDGPMPDQNGGDSHHYDLHAWLWKANPDGMFAPFNPRVICH